MMFSRRFTNWKKNSIIFVCNVRMVCSYLLFSIGSAVIFGLSFCGLLCFIVLHDTWVLLGTFFPRSRCRVVPTQQKFPDNESRLAFFRIVFNNSINAIISVKKELKLKFLVKKINSRISSLPNSDVRSELGVLLEFVRSENTNWFP